MKRFFVLTTLSIVTFTILCTALIGIARAQPIPPIPLLDDITDCGGQLCFRGVILGKTDASDAKTLLANYPDMKNVELSDAMLEEVKASTSDGTILFSSQDNQQANRSKIGYMEITFEVNSRPTFADLVLHLGSPCKVILADRGGLFIKYRGLEMSVDTLQPSLPISEIFSINDWTPCQINFPTIEWRWPGWKTDLPN